MLRISRIYRDARRLYGRGPYKSNLWFTLRMAGEDWTHMPVFWFEIYPKGYAYGLGAYDAKPAQMAKFRQAVDTDPKPMLKLAHAFDRQDRFRRRNTSAPRAAPSRPWTSGTTGRIWTSPAPARWSRCFTARSWWMCWWRATRASCPITAIFPRSFARGIEAVF